MILKKTIRFVSYALAFLGLGSVQSCKDDDPSGELCYRCTWTDTYDGDTYNYSDTFCFEDAQAYNPDLTKAEFEAYITLFKGEYDADCDKKSLQ
jgi:hypothetical protein